MIHKHDDCRTLAVPTVLLPYYRRAVEEAIQSLLYSYGMLGIEPSRLTAEQSANLRRLHRLRMALHEEY